MQSITTVAAVRLKSTNKQIFRALLSLASAALLTRMAGLVNQVIISSHFGAGAAMDAYFVASALPTFAAYVVINAFEAAVIPVYCRLRAQGDRKQASLLFSTLLNLSLAVTVLLTLAMLVFRQQCILFTAPALDQLRLGLATGLAPFIFPVFALMVIIGFLECILNAEGQFGWPAYAGLLVPLTAAVFVVLGGSVLMLSAGMLLGLSLQLCAFIMRARRAKLVYRPVLLMRNPAVSQVLAAAWPVLLGSLIGQASPLIDQVFASFLSEGSISALGYSLKLVSVCSGVIFASVGRAVLPYLSKQAGNNDMQGFKETLRLYLWIVGIGTICISIFMIVLAHPIVHLLFQRGAFTAEDTNRTATTLVGFMVGLAPMSLGIVTARAFSALGKTRIFMGLSMFSVISNVVFDAIFAKFWQSEGIALATSAVYLCTMCIMFVALRRMIGRLNLLTPPAEFKKVLENVSAHPMYQRYVSWKGKAESVHQLLIYLAIAITVFAIGTAGTHMNAPYTLRVAIGSIVMLALLRYRFALLIVWIIASVIVSPKIPIFTNNNVLTVLTVPTLCLMPALPVRQAFRRMPTLLFLLLYLLWVFAGIGISAIGSGSFLTIWLTFLDYLAIALLTIHLLGTRQRLLRLIDTLILGAVFVSLYGIYGYIMRQNGVFDPTTSVYRIFSIFSAAPPLALFLSVVIPLAIYRAATLRGIRRLGMVLSVLLLVVTIGLTFSRSAFISLPLSVGVLLLCLPSRKLKIGLFAGMVGLGIGIIVLTTVGHVPLLSRFFNQDLATLNGRTYLWQAVLDHFHPEQLLGNGLHASDALLANLQVGFNGNLISTSSSNLFLDTLYDHGIIGLLLLTLVLAALFTTLVRGMLKTRGEQRTLFVMALAIFVSVFLQSFDVNDFWTQAVGIYFWIIMALPFALCWSRQVGASNQEVVDRDTIPQLAAIRLTGRL